jgi:hypothetical protein
MAEKLIQTGPNRDSMRTAFPKINQSIDDSNEALSKAKSAEMKSISANVAANSVQEQFNQVTIEGDSSVEAAQARVNKRGQTFSTLKERIDFLDTETELRGVNVKWYGAVADGVTDDSISIQSVIDSVEDNTTIIFPKGEYVINQTIQINKPIHLVGFETNIITTSEGFDVFFKFTNVNNFSVSGFIFDQKLKGRTSIDMYDCKNFKIYNNYFTGYSAEFAYYQTDGGIRINDSTDGFIYANTWEDHGFQYDETTATLNRCLTIQTSGADLSDRIIVSNNIFRRVNQAICLNSGSNNIIEGNIFEDVKDNSVYALGMPGLLVSGNTFNDKYDESVVISGENINIVNNTFKDIPNKVIAIAGNASNLSITGNLIKCGNVSNIFAYRSGDHSITNFKFSENLISVVGNTNNFPYMDIQGDCDEFIISDNIFNVNTYPDHEIIRFYKLSNGLITGNRFKGTDATSRAVSASGTPSGEVIIKDNQMKNCRIVSSSSILIVQGYRSQLNPNYANYIPKFKELYALNAPTSGTWSLGDKVYNEAPSAGSYEGWICVSGGSPGTWKGFGAIQA